MKKLFRIPFKRKERMAKRYTDSEKWKKDFIKTLPTEYKLFWLYLLDECDHAGIWHVELDIAEIRLGYKLSITKIRGLFKDKVVEFDNGTKWFIPDFISFQYGQLDAKNKAHKSVVDRLERYVKKGLPRVIQDPKDKDKEKDTSLSNNTVSSTTNARGKNLPGMPTHEDVHEPSTQILQVVCETIYQNKSRLVTPEQVLTYWHSWKILNIAGDKFFATENDVYKYFTNVCKGMDWKGDKQTSSYQLTERDKF